MFLSSGRSEASERAWNKEVNLYKRALQNWLNGYNMLKRIYKYIRAITIYINVNGKMASCIIYIELCEYDKYMYA